jgi:hypothetical protein
MPYLPYDSTESADARSAEFWAQVRGDGWREGDVTQYLYGRRQRTGDPESDADLPDGVDYAIRVTERDQDLDTLLIGKHLTADEYSAIIEVYPDWSGGGVEYETETPSIVRHNGQLWRCVQSHPSQVDREPGVALSLWTLTVPPGVIAAWVQPTGGHDAYDTGALVTHDGYIWRSNIDANVWEPGSVGADDIWTQLEAL